MRTLRRAVIYRTAEVGLFVLMVLAVLGVMGPLVYATARPEDAQAQAVSRLWQGAAQMLWAGAACLGLPFFAAMFVAARVREWAAARITRINYDVSRLVKREDVWEWHFERTQAEDGGDE